MPVLADPVAAGQAQEQRSVEAAGRAEVGVLDGGGVPQLGGARAGLEALLLPQRGFPFDQQAESLAVFKGAAFGIGFQFLESFGHAVQAKPTQSIQCRMLQHGRYCPQWK
jgi:hypothetical protein